MKPSSAALISFLNTVRASSDAPLSMADAFTFTLRSGLVLCYTNADVPFSYDGNTYLGNSILVDGLKYKAAVGLEVDRQQITISARSTDTIAGGAPFLQALRDGSFDFCQIERARVFSFLTGLAARRSALYSCSRAGSASSTKLAAPAPNSPSIPTWCCSMSTCRATSTSRRAFTRCTTLVARWSKRTLVPMARSAPAQPPPS